MYSIGEVSQMFSLNISTLRYYDNEGLIPNIDRNESGIRRFSEQSIQALRVVECLKKSGMKIKDIKQFMKWCMEGNSTFAKRKALFEKRKESVEKEIKELEKVLNMIKFKCWYYDEAIKDNSEERVINMKFEDMPDEIKEALENTL